jgi:hypothetical protein
MRDKITVVLIIIPLALIYVSNLAFDFHPEGRIEAGFFIFSAIYIVSWMILLLWSVKIKSIALIGVCAGFWTVELVYFALIALAGSFDSIFSEIVSVIALMGLPVLGMPLAGFDFLAAALRRASNSSILYMMPFLIISIGMMLFGRTMKRRSQKPRFY